MMKCSFHHKNVNNNERASVSPLISLVQESLLKKNQNSSDCNKSNTTTPSSYKKTLGNRYIPLRQTEEEWSKRWLNDGSSGVIFENNTKNNSKGKFVNLNEKGLLDMVLRNEMLNENISSPIRCTDYTITHQPSLLIKPKPPPLLSFGSGDGKENTKMNNCSLTTPYPFKGATVELLSMKMKYSLGVNDLPLSLIETKVDRNNYNEKPLDWSSKNLLACGIGKNVYLKDYKEPEFYKFGSDREYTILKFNPSGDKLFLGSGGGYSRVVDVTDKSIVTKTYGRIFDDVTDVTWLDDHTVGLSTPHGYIIFYDTRDYQMNPLVFYDCNCSVTNVEINKSGRYLASGRACSIVNTWCVRSRKVIDSFLKHDDMITALEWSNYSDNVILSGGKCRRLYMRDINVPENLRYIDTGYPINGIHMMNDGKNVITTHGFSTSDVVVWNSLKLNPATIISCNGNRTVHSAMSPDRNILCTITSCGIIFFWDMKAKSGKNKNFHRSKLDPHYFVR
uniref:WD_REPEATS_REGION domain-containing protein n=1 Tax=Strongyloides papillosus TaxID=174720 RepID=A0A0N5B919_STREA